MVEVKRIFLVGEETCLLYNGSAHARLLCKNAGIQVNRNFGCKNLSILELKLEEADTVSNLPSIARKTLRCTKRTLQRIFT